MPVTYSCIATILQFKNEKFKKNYLEFLNIYFKNKYWTLQRQEFWKPSHPYIPATALLV